MALILKLKLGQSLLINDEFTITLSGRVGNEIRLALQGPPEKYHVLRLEARDNLEACQDWWCIRCDSALKPYPNAHSSNGKCGNCGKLWRIVT